MIYGPSVTIIFSFFVCYNNIINSVFIFFFDGIESKNVPHVLNCLFALMYISHKLTV